MTGHAKDAFRRKYHGSCTDIVSAGVTDPARRLCLRNLHIVNRTDAVYSGRPAPGDFRTLFISDGFHPLKMAGPAPDCAVQIMSYFFIVGQVALAAVTQALVFMAVCRGPGMANQAIQVSVRRRCILRHINQGK